MVKLSIEFIISEGQELKTTWVLTDSAEIADLEKSTWKKRLKHSEFFAYKFEVFIDHVSIYVFVKNEAAINSLKKYLKKFDQSGRKFPKNGVQTSLN